VLKAVLIAVNWPTVVLDFAWIAWMSLRSVWTAVLTAVFVVEFVEPRAEVSVLVLAWATSELGAAWAWCKPAPNRESTTRSSKQSQDSSVRLRRRGVGDGATTRQGAISVYQTFSASYIGSSPVTR